MMRKKVFYHLCCLLAGCWVLTAGMMVRAASVRVAPASVYLQVGGGESKTLTYLLDNESNQDLWLTLEAMSFAPSQENGLPELLTHLEFPYITLTDSSASALPRLLLPAKSTTPVSVTVAPPLGIREKEYPVTVFFVTSAVTPADSNTRVEMKIGSNLIITTDQSNLDKSQLLVDKLQAPLAVDTFLRPSFGLTVRNQGPLGTLLHGRVVLQKQNGVEVMSWPLWPDLILAQSTRLGRVNLTDADGNIALTDKIHLPRWLLGRYRLVVEISSGHPQASGQIITDSVSFFAFPYCLTIVAILGIIAYLSANYLIRKKRPKEKDQFQAKLGRMRRQRQYFD